MIAASPPCSFPVPPFLQFLFFIWFLDFTSFTRVPLGFTSFTRVPLGFTSFTRVPLGFTSFTRVPLGFTSFTRVPLGFTSLMRAPLDLPRSQGHLWALPGSRGHLRALPGSRGYLWALPRSQGHLWTYLVHKGTSGLTSFTRVWGFTWFLWCLDMNLSRGPIRQMAPDVTKIQKFMLIILFLGGIMIFKPLSSLNCLLCFFKLRNDLYIPPPPPFLSHSYLVVETTYSRHVFSLITWTSLHGRYPLHSSHWLIHLFIKLSPLIIRGDFNPISNGGVLWKLHDEYLLSISMNVVLRNNNKSYIFKTGVHVYLIHSSWIGGGGGCVRISKGGPSF